MIDIKKILKADFRRNMKYVLSFLPDKTFLQIHYFLTTWKFINFKNPKGFNEKLQWLKVNDKRPEYTKLVDKLAVRDHIADVLGEEYLFPLLGKWKSFDQIDFDDLPEQFVLKCNHDSGSTKVIKEKSLLTKADFDEMNEFYTKHLKRDFYFAGREYPYKGIEPYIIAEQLMINEKAPDESIEDYKFLCFNGEPKLLMIISGRNKKAEGGYHEDYVDMDYNRVDVVNGATPSEELPPQPKNFEQMKEIVKKLSEGIPTVRMDLYELNGKIYFGEYTFYTGGGFVLFEPEEWERKLGDWIDLK